MHEAIEAITRAIATTPGDAPLYLLRGDMHRQHGDWPAAERDFATVETLDRALFAVDLARGQMLSDAGRDTEAKAAFDRFIAHQPESALGYTARARALMKAKNAASASEDFAAAISHSSPPDPALFIEHSRALHATGRVPEAIQTLDAGIAKLGPLIALAQEAIAIEEAAGHFAEALARIEKVIESAPRKERWLVRRAALLEKMERPREAREALIAARAAIESLSADRRVSAAMTELAAEIDAALARIGPR